jgi:N6-adenosine-specific RNA methylase IME4
METVNLQPTLELTGTPPVGFSELLGCNFKAIMADPPWDYGCKSPRAPDRPGRDRGENPGSVNHYYQTMKLDEICAIPVADMAAKDACLFLWATVPLLPEAFEVMKAWGFKYKTKISWHKLNAKGMGFWFRGCHEELLLGVRGDVRAFQSSQKNLIQTNRGRHSAKPDQFYELVEKVCQPPLLELFGRRKRPGWTVFGNEVEGDLLAP